ncbi:hypothetical protein B0H13DRAFT_1935741 [Mycena leptocephala]|nr:hypothetical protein B0H13DRAFT_1935741 [Mycena leptocephala]
MPNGLQGRCASRGISKTADSSLTSLPGRQRRQRRKFLKDIASLLGRFKTLGKDVTSWERRQRHMLSWTSLTPGRFKATQDERKILRASENNTKGHGGRLLRQLHGNGSYTGYVGGIADKLGFDGPSGIISDFATLFGDRLKPFGDSRLSLYQSIVSEKDIISCSINQRLGKSRVIDQSGGNGGKARKWRCRADFEPQPLRIYAELSRHKQIGISSSCVHSNSSRIRSQGQWVLQRCPNVLPTPEGDGLRKRFSFPTGSFKATEMSENSKESRGVDENLQKMVNMKADVRATATIDTLRCMIVVALAFDISYSTSEAQYAKHIFSRVVWMSAPSGRIGLDLLSGPLVLVIGSAGITR